MDEILFHERKKTAPWIKSIYSNLAGRKFLKREERQQYVSLYISEFDAQNIKERIDGAIDADKKGEYELCLIKYTYGKGDANAILSVMGVRKDVLVRSAG